LSPIDAGLPASAILSFDAKQTRRLREGEWGDVSATQT